MIPFAHFFEGPWRQGHTPHNPKQLEEVALELSILWEGLLSIESVGFRVLGNVGALIIRIGFWAHYTIAIIKSSQTSIGNYLGPYITLFGGPFCQGASVLSLCEVSIALF